MPAVARHGLSADKQAVLTVIRPENQTLASLENGNGLNSGKTGNL
jgi:hypothetical protein